MSHGVEKFLSTQDQPEYLRHGQTTCPIVGVPRRVRVKGMDGVDAAVVVTVVQGKVWLSISPPFIWEAIMEPGKVDEVMSILELARDEAKKVAAARLRRKPGDSAEPAKAGSGPP